MKSVWITMVTVRSLLLISVSWVAGPTSRELRSGIEIILGMVPSGFPVFKATIPGCSRNGSGTYPYLRVQKKFVKFGQSTQNTSLCSTNFLGQFFSNLASISSETCVIYSSVIPGTNVFWDWMFLALSCVSLETTASFCLSLRVAITLEEIKAQQLRRLNWFFVLEINSW